MLNTRKILTLLLLVFAQACIFPGNGTPYPGQAPGAGYSPSLWRCVSDDSRHLVKVALGEESDFEAELYSKNDAGALELAETWKDVEEFSLPSGQVSYVQAPYFRLSIDAPEEDDTSSSTRKASLKTLHSDGMPGLDTAMTCRRGTQ